MRRWPWQSLEIRAEGARWKLNLDALRKEMPKILSFPDVNAGYDGPAVFLRGGQSEYVRGAHETAVRERFPQAQIETLEGAGHWLHAEDPRGFEAAVRAVLD